MSLLNVGARALMANQLALQTTGHNIANVNTAGYSRQTVAFQTSQGQNMGNGYIGNGVDVATIVRNFSELLNRQAAAATAASASDSARSQSLNQMQEVFSGGSNGLGAAINDMMNSFADVSASPTDLTSRNVVLTRMSEL
ncbi:MAG: flagellar basal body protein, partial [Comamonas sp.]